MTEKEITGVFNDSMEIGSLFESITETETIDLEPEKVDLFSEKEEQKDEVKNEGFNLFKEEDKDEKEKDFSSENTTPYGEAI